MVIGSIKSSWRPETSGISQGLVVGPILFNIFINSLGGGVECTLNKLADKTNPREVACTPDSHTVIQRDLRRLMKFSKQKDKVL